MARTYAKFSEESASRGARFAFSIITWASATHGIEKKEKTMRLLMVATLLVLGLCTQVEAQVDLQTIKGRLRTTEQKRDFLRARMLLEIADANRLETMTTKLETMDAGQVDSLLDQYFAQTAKNQADRNTAARAELARAAAERDALAARLAASRGVGFAPVITTLPTGTSLGVGATVSPDRRYVRINAQPFFSQVGPVRTFNPVTGQSGYAPQGYYPNQYPYGQSPYNQNYNPNYNTGYNYNTPNYNYRTPNYGNNQRQQNPHIQSYHDGLRTRYGTPPKKKKKNR